MGLRKKGILFIFAAIILVFIVILAFAVQSKYRLQNKMFVVETRIDTLNDFLLSMQEDLSRSVYISSYRAILSLEQHINNHGIYIDNVELRFKELMNNGTINGSLIDIMENATILNWVGRISEIASKIGIRFNISIDGISLYQEDPWTIDINMNVSINLSDSKETAKWDNSFSLNSKVPIEGFEDPSYLINSFGRVSNIIIKSNYTDFSNITILKSHINHSYYIASETGPSFLQRLAGNFSNSTDGIESIVNINKFIEQEIPIEVKSHVDYIYFDAINPPNCQVNETSTDPYLSWFHLDSNHLIVYDSHCI